MNKEAVNQRIQALESGLAGLKAELAKSDKFEFNYEFSNTYNVTGHTVVQNCTGEINDALQNFRYRQTEANAKADFQLQKELMCISALAEQIDPDYKSRVDWYNHACRKYHISYDYQEKNYYVSSSLYSRMLGVVFMPQEVATQVCKILNNKGVEL